MTMQSARLRTVSALTGTTLAFAAAAVALTGTAAQADCSHRSADLDYGSDQVVAAAGTSGEAIRTGPHVGCSRVITLATGRWVTLDCYTEGDTVAGRDTWSRVRYSNGGPVYQGWLPDSRLREHGAQEECPA
ncbi:hypothetical protein [Actinoplanes sp. NPDC049316]|uniref:hypothetical protein n=1 Tax=Actinoplanes sp. NPDC049316 TaxID=3154727 RepID=UPI0034191DFE